MRALHTAGLRVPDDISVIGHDDVGAATLVTPALTTIRVAKHDMGTLSLQLLYDRSTSPVHPPQHVLTTERLIVRDSVRNMHGGPPHPVNSRIIP